METLSFILMVIPQLANVAINQGKNLATNLLNNKSQKEYEYKDLGSMATVGKYRTVVDLSFIKFQGFLFGMYGCFYT